jgi:hypothetical protein
MAENLKRVSQLGYHESLIGFPHRRETERIDEAAARHRVKLKFISRSPEEKAKRRRLWKLNLISHLEHEACGEEDW